MLFKMLPSTIIKDFLKSEISSSCRVLDIGCGEGSSAVYLASTLGCTVEGIDLDKGKLHRALEKFDESSAKGLVLCHFCDSRKIDEKFSNESFDCVIIIHALHHLSEISEVLSKSHNVLKFGGKIIIGEYNQSYGESRDNCPRFSPKKINSMLKTAGFKEIKQKLFDNLVMTIALR